MCAPAERQTGDVRCGGAEVEGASSIRTVRPSLTAAYSKRLADASAEANAEKFFTEVDHTGVQRQDALNAALNVTRVAKHKKLAKDEFVGRKQELEGDLFSLFEKKDHWATKEVQVRAGLLAHGGDQRKPARVIGGRSRA